MDNGIGQEEDTDLTKLESWFDDCDAPQKVLDYLTSEDFPLSPTNTTDDIAASLNVLDLGCGNGSSLFELKLEGEYAASMIGVDYAQKSVDLARKLWQKHIDESGDAGQYSSITFEQFDLLKDDPATQLWWPSMGFDLVLDKGTFDAISLSGETTRIADKDVRIVETYPGKVINMIKPGGFLLITSCNWTEDEIVRWFTQTSQVKDLLEVFGRVKYPTFQFGGHQGQGVASVCFRKSS